MQWMLLKNIEKTLAYVKRMKGEKRTFLVIYYIFCCGRHGNAALFIGEFKKNTKLFCA